MPHSHRGAARSHGGRQHRRRRADPRERPRRPGLVHPRQLGRAGHAALLHPGRLLVTAALGAPSGHRPAPRRLRARAHRAAAEALHRARRRRRPRPRRPARGRCARRDRGHRGIPHQPTAMVPGRLPRLLRARSAAGARASAGPRGHPRRLGGGHRGGRRAACGLRHPGLRAAQPGVRVVVRAATRLLVGRRPRRSDVAAAALSPRGGFVRRARRPHGIRPLFGQHVHQSQPAHRLPGPAGRGAARALLARPPRPRAARRPRGLSRPRSRHRTERHDHLPLAHDGSHRLGGRPAPPPPSAARAQHRRVVGDASPLADRLGAPAHPRRAGPRPLRTRGGARGRAAGIHT